MGKLITAALAAAVLVSAAPTQAQPRYYHHHRWHHHYGWHHRHHCHWRHGRRACWR